MRSFKFLALALLSLSLAACSYMGDSNRVSVPRTKDSNNPPLRTPPGMDLSYNSLYPIPKRIYPLDVKQVNITPPGLPRSIGSTS